MKFILLIRRADRIKELSPAEIQSVVDKYRAWAQKMRDENRLVDAEGLSGQGHVLESEGGVITDGPFVESKEAIGGYYIFTADSEEEAIAISRECPAMTIGGSIELRPVMVYG